MRLTERQLKAIIKEAVIKAVSSINENGGQDISKIINNVRKLRITIQKILNDYKEIERMGDGRFKNSELNDWASEVATYSVNWLKLLSECEETYRTLGGNCPVYVTEFMQHDYQLCYDILDMVRTGMHPEELRDALMNVSETMMDFLKTFYQSV